jgi:ATP-binding cassette subfamily B protein
MKYNLNDLQAAAPKSSTWSSLGKLLKLISHERRNLFLALLAILANSGLNLYAWYLIGKTIDQYIFTAHKDYHGVLVNCGILLAMYGLAFFASYSQTITMGGVGQRMLFTLRNAIFNKLQILPVGFFNQNKAGDLISRINNDTDKLNQFFSQSLMQFIGSIATMLGAGIFLLSINVKLGAGTLVPAVVILIFTGLTSAWVKRKNARNLKTVGGMSAEIQESLTNFKVIIAFNRRDYFRKRFEEANKENYDTAIGAGIANNFYVPVYQLFSSFAQLIVFAYGVYLISIGEFKPGLLITYFSYANQFYNPLRQLAALWSGFQTAMAGWDRIEQILALDTDLVTVPAVEAAETSTLGQPAVVKQPRHRLLHGFMMLPTARCCWMARISAPITRQNVRRRLALFCRNLSCLPAPCATIFFTVTKNM